MIATNANWTDKEIGDKLNVEYLRYYSLLSPTLTLRKKFKNLNLENRCLVPSDNKNVFSVLAASVV